VAGHTFTVVGADANYLTPFRTDMVTIVGNKPRLGCVHGVSSLCRVCGARASCSCVCAGVHGV